MHIIKTAFKKAWPNSLDNSILLGDWCINEDSLDTNEIDKLKIIDYHFNDRKKLYDSKKEINKIYDELLIILTSSLNKLFKKNNNKRYWEIIWGCWLHTFILVLFDRNISIENILKKHPNSVTNILNPKSYIIASNTAEYLNNVQSDFYNFQIYSSLWSKYEGNINSIISNSYKTKNTINSIYYYCKILLMNFCRPFFELIFKKSNIISYSTGFPKKTLLKIIFKSNFKIIPFELFADDKIKNSKKINQDLILRYELKNILIKFKKKNNNFLNLCLDLISEHTPISILEGYNRTIRINNNIGKVKYLFSANGFLNDPWNILCAENIKNGAKLINCQHGGGYGIQKFSGLEDYEINVADKYITTGWKLSPNHKFTPMPLPFINKNRNKKINKNGGVFYIRNDYSPYLYRIFSHPIGKYTGLYRKWPDRFLQKLDSIVLFNTLVRFNLKSHSQYSYESFKQKHQKVKYDDNTKNFNYQLKNCKIAISDTNQTTYLQSIALNIPTIVFWNPKSTEIRKDAKLFIDDLNRVGILHYSPESAASFLNLTYESIDKWWMSNEVQKVRNNFISNYANISDSWEDDWIKFFNKILDE